MKLFLIALTTLLCVVSQAQNELGKTKIERAKPLRLEYSSKAWNKDPNSADSSNIIFRDSNSGKLAKIELVETDNDSSVFVGFYAITWETSGEIVPEIFLIPKKMSSSAEQLKNIENLIKDGTLLRKPYFVRIDRNSQSIRVFDNSAQAIQAYEEFRKTPTGKPVVDPAALEAQRKAAMKAEEARLADLARRQELERKRLEELELRRKEELKRQAELMDAAEKARRQAKAKQLAAEAMNLYRAENFVESEKKFAEATELDPNNNAFYYQYGVVLYKNEKFQKSLVVLDNAKGNGVNAGELLYFKGLNHMKLKEFDTAKKEFEIVKSKNDKNISPTAAFLAGVIDFQREKYEDAKKNFEWVLDNSEDPKMDQQCDSYIEQIANIMAFEAERRKRFLFTFNFGLMFDSNILAVSNSQIDAGTATGLEGYRWMYGGSAEYRMVYGPTHEFSAILNASDMYSQDKNFKAEASFQNTDPLSMSLSTPYKYKGMIGTKPYQLGLTPSYETISMNADATGPRELIIASTVMKIDQTFVMNDNWFSALNLEHRNDSSKIEVSSTDDDSSATKSTLMTTNTFFQDQKKTVAWIAELGGSSNNAKGVNQRYSRYDLGVTYMFPVFKDAAMTAKLGYYNANYSEHTSGRTDRNTALSVSYSQPLTESLRLAISANYSTNASTQSSSDYKKYTLMTMLSWNGSISETKKEDQPK